MNHTPRRSHDRFSCEMAIWLKPQDAAEEDFNLVEVRNIGAGGVLCQVQQDHQVGTILDIRIELPQREDMVRVLGQTRHLRALEEDEEFLVGIQFTEVEGMTVPAFMAYIEAMFV